MTQSRRHFLRQASGYLGSAAGWAMVPAGGALGLLGESTAQAGDSSGAEHTWLDLSAAQIYAAPEISPREERCLLVLTQEVEKRTELRLPIVHAWPASGPVVVAGTNATMNRIHGHLGGTAPVARQADGYAIRAEQSGGIPVVAIAGTDERGVLFGIGKLLRSLRMTRLKVEVADNLDAASSPKYSIRGHQLGYRPKTNAYDAWTVAMWDQYIRELALFGCNMVELIPPRSDDDADSPHFPLPQK